MQCLVFFLGQPSHFRSLVFYASATRGLALPLVVLRTRPTPDQEQLAARMGVRLVGIWEAAIFPSMFRRIRLPLDGAAALLLDVIHLSWRPRALRTLLQDFFLATLERLRSASTIDSIFTSYSPVAFLASDVSVSQNLDIAREAARRHGIPAVQLGLCHPAVDLTFQRRRMTLERWGGANTWGMALWRSTRKAWFREHVPILSLGKMISNEAVHPSPKMPWSFDTLSFDAFFVESQAVAEWYARAGVGWNKIRITGSPMLDELWQAAQNVLSDRESLGLSPEDRVLLTSVPQDYYPEHEAPPFPSYENLLSFWMDELRQVQGYKVVVSLHPNTRKEVEEMLQTMPCIVSHRGAAELLPLSSYFVTYISTTVRWARSLDKPVIVYDCYGFSMEEFAGLPGVLLARDAETFSSFTQSIAKGGQAVADRDGFWGRVDGNGGQAFTKNLAEFISSSPAGRAVAKVGS